VFVNPPLPYAIDSCLGTTSSPITRTLSGHLPAPVRADRNVHAPDLCRRITFAVQNCSDSSYDTLGLHRSIMWNEVCLERPSAFRPQQWLWQESYPS